MEREGYGYDERAAAEWARDAAPRRGRHTECGEASEPADGASGGPDPTPRAARAGTAAAEPGKPRFRIFTGDRVLWIIIAALAVISVLVVYSSTAKMAYDAHTARSTAHFLRQQLEADRVAGDAILRRQQRLYRCYQCSALAELDLVDRQTGAGGLYERG